MQRFIIEMGMGNDLPPSSSEAVGQTKTGQDYTRAAGRAIEDALRRSSIPMLGALGIDQDTMRVQVTVAVAEPGQVDCAALAATLPHERAEVRAVKGGLNVTNPDTGEVTVVAQAAVEVFLPTQG